MVSLLTPIKTEGVTDVGQPNLYRFSPSPAPSMRYHTFQPETRSSSAPSFENEPQRHSFSAGSSSAPSIPFQSSSSTPNMPYNTIRNPARPPFSNAVGGGRGGGNYPGQRCDDNGVYVGQYAADTPPHQSFCSRSNNPVISHSLMALTQQLQGTLDSIRQYSNHNPTTSQCLLYRRIIELNNLIQYVSRFLLFLIAAEYRPRRSETGPTEGNGASFDDISNSTDSDIMTPLSATSSHASFHRSPAGPSPQEWHTMSTAGYNQYYSVPSGDDANHGMFNN
jgi:hypothetical protein